jgi:hypothetical protein
VPLKQSVQLTALIVPEYLPLTQVVHVFSFSLNVPALQKKYAGGVSLQTFSCIFTNLPVGHEVQDEPAESEYLPSMHVLHTLSSSPPTTVENLPGGHVSQLLPK